MVYGRLSSDGLVLVLNGHIVTSEWAVNRIRLV